MHLGRTLPADQFDWSSNCKDKAGHAAFRATIEADYGEREVAESATVCVDFDPAALDKFLIELQQVEGEHRGSASMINGAS